VRAAYTIRAQVIASRYWLRLKLSLSGGLPRLISSASRAPVWSRAASQNGPVMIRPTVKVPEKVYCRKLSPRQMRVGSHSPTTRPVASRAVTASPSAVQSGQVRCNAVHAADAAPPAVTTQT
jgi:hypothetical protein